MAKKKRAARRAPQARAQARSGLALPGFLRRHARPFVGGSLLAVILAAILLLTNPFGPETALDASGERVNTGPIDTPGAAPRIGRPAPNFVLADYDGNAVRLSDFEGKVVFLNFWATWCTACEAEMPDMERLAAKYADDLVVVAVNRGESRGKAKNWSDARDLESLVFLVDQRESISGTYSLPNGMPQSLFIDRQGFITAKIGGAQTFATMEQNYRDAARRPDPTPDSAALRAARRSVAAVAAAAAARRGRRRR